MAAARVHFRPALDVFYICATRVWTQLHGLVVRTIAPQLDRMELLDSLQSPSVSSTHVCQPASSGFTSCTYSSVSQLDAHSVTDVC
jgi:hypothetical protein